MNSEAIEKQALEAIVGGDPQGAALRTLELVKGHLGASSVGLFSIRPELLLFTATAIDQDGLDRVASAWDEGSLQLVQGELLMGPAHVIVPIGRPVTALLYAACTGHRRDQVLRLRDAVAPLLELALSLRANGDSYLERTPIDKIERAQLLMLLDRVKGNVSEVARRLGVTRVTVYQRLKRFGIHGHRPARKKP